jgi:hypothetical protein
MTELNIDSIKQLLTRSAEQPTLAVQTKLRAAREQALLHYDGQPASAHAWAWAGMSTGSGMHRAPIYGASAVLFAIMLFGAATWWQHTTKDNEDTEVDIAILTDEMPVSVYAN